VLDGGAIQLVGFGSPGQRGARSGRDAERQLRSRRVGAVDQLPHCIGGDPGLAAAGGSFDPLQQAVAVYAEVVVFNGRVGCGQRLAILAEAVVQHGRRVLHDGDHDAFTAYGGAVQACAHELQRRASCPR
jgi:hypothetical protein